MWKTRKTTPNTGFPHTLLNFLDGPLERRMSVRVCKLTCVWEFDDFIFLFLLFLLLALVAVTLVVSLSVAILVVARSAVARTRRRRRLS